MLHYEGASGLLAYLLSALTNNITETAGSGHPLQYPGLLPSPRALHCLGGTTYFNKLLYLRFTFISHQTFPVPFPL